MVVTVIFLLWIFPLLFVCAQTGEMWILKMFPTTLTKVNEEQMRIAMPASTKIFTAGEVNDNFVTRRSLLDTGSDAYLRQDDSMMNPLFSSSTLISTAGPEQLTASHSGLLHLIVKDDKGHLHRSMLENALVVLRSSHNLTSHKQFVENGHLVFFHESQAGIVLNTQQKFSSSDIVIPFAMGENGMYDHEENLPEEKAVAMVAQRMQKLTNAKTRTYITMSRLSVINDPDLQREYRAIVGSLMYLYQWTRPDLGFAVTFLSRYLHRPGEKHLEAAKYNLLYLNGTVGLGIDFWESGTRSTTNCTVCIFRQ